MTILDTLALFKSLKARTDNKSEIKIYNIFIGILLDLERRKLSEAQLLLIENELDKLELNADVKNRRKYLSKKLDSFKKYLKDELSLISEGYYTAICISLGISFGAAFGVVFDELFGISYGVSGGLLLGVVVGRLLDSQAEKQNRVLKIKNK